MNINWRVVSSAAIPPIPSESVCVFKLFIGASMKIDEVSPSIPNSHFLLFDHQWVPGRLSASHFEGTTDPPFTSRCRFPFPLVLHARAVASLFRYSNLGSRTYADEDSKFIEIEKNIIYIWISIELIKIICYCNVFRRGRSLRVEFL